MTQLTAESALNVHKGLIYNVTFDDGSTRRMRNLDQKVGLCHAWVDLSTHQVVTMSWLIDPDGNGPKRVRFNNPGGTGFTAAFGGAIVKRMTLDIELGGTVSWLSQAGGTTRIKTGVVEEVVHAGCLPDRDRITQLYSSSFVGKPRNHPSYVVRERGKTPQSARTIYWPRVSSLTAN